jgi:hypothetical protein
LCAHINTAYLQADKKLSSMFARVRKHLGTTTLAFRVWEAIQEQLLLRYLRVVVVGTMATVHVLHR